MATTPTNPRAIMLFQYHFMLASLCLLRCSSSPLKRPCGVCENPVKSAAAGVQGLDRTLREGARLRELVGERAELFVGVLLFDGVKDAAAELRGAALLALGQETGFSRGRVTLEV